MLQPPKNPALVLVEWKDANVGGDDVVTLENVDTFHKPTVVRTLGWLLKESSDGITLVNEYYDDCYRGRTFIYAPMIVSITRYKLSQQRKQKDANG